MADRYPSFSALAAEKVVGQHYRVVAEKRNSAVVVIAPHGGTIEPTTSEIAAAIAGTDYSLYAFEGLTAGVPHSELHITSTQFDEPVGCALVETAQVVVAVHGRMDRTDPRTVWMGGRDKALADAVMGALVDAGHRVDTRPPRFSGSDSANICNRGLRGKGVQLEIPRSLRDSLRNDPAALAQFAGAIRSAIERYVDGMTRRK